MASSMRSCSCADACDGQSAATAREAAMSRRKQVNGVLHPCHEKAGTSAELTCDDGKHDEERGEGD